MNPKPCPVYDDEGNIVADDYPPDYYYLEHDIGKITSLMEFFVAPNECQNKIAELLNSYTKKYYLQEGLSFFDDYSIEEIISKSHIAQEWKERFQLMKQRKQEFLELPICKRVSKIIDER